MILIKIEKSILSVISNCRVILVFLFAFISLAAADPVIQVTENWQHSELIAINTLPMEYIHVKHPDPDEKPHSVLVSLPWSNPEAELNSQSFIAPSPIAAVNSQSFIVPCPIAIANSQSVIAPCPVVAANSQSVIAPCPVVAANSKPEISPRRIVKLNPPSVMAPPSLTVLKINSINAQLNAVDEQIKIRATNQSNHFTQHNTRNAIELNQKFILNVKNTRWVQQINDYQRHYRSQFYKDNEQRFKKYHSFSRNQYYRNWYKKWYIWGFYGGFSYPIVAEHNMLDYFSYPVVQWFYVDGPVDLVASGTYYSTDPDSESTCSSRFPYKHVFFPTDTMRDLLIEASSFSHALRCHFRTAILVVTEQLKQKLSNNFFVNFSFHPNDIVINYYVNLENKAILISGFVNQGKINMAFEALLDLQKPKKTIVFAPNGPVPTDAQLQALNQLNTQIIELGGEPFATSQEPQVGIDKYGANQGSAAGP